MAIAAPRLRYTYQDYLRHEAVSDDKHEYVGGLIQAMAGGMLEHGALASAVVIALGRSSAAGAAGSSTQMRALATGGEPTS